MRFFLQINGQSEGPFFTGPVGALIYFIARYSKKGVSQYAA